MNKKLAVHIIICAIVFCKSITAQNYIDHASKLKIALYLANNHNYEVACSEIYPLQYQGKLPIKILSSYYYDWALKSGKKNIPVTIIPESDTARYLKFLYQCKYNPCSSHSTPTYTDSSLKQASLALISALETENQSYIRKKNRAIFLSACIPGLGKIYAKQYWEGISTFGIVSLLSTYSVGGFYLGGRYSLPGWGFGCVALVAYFAQVKGSVYTLKRLYKARKETLIDEAHHKVLF